MTAQDVSWEYLFFLARRAVGEVEAGCTCPDERHQNLLHDIAFDLAALAGRSPSAEYERGLADGRAQVVAAVEAVVKGWDYPRPASGWDSGLSATESGTRLGIWSVTQRRIAELTAALAPHSDALAKHDAEVLRAAADEFANGHQADKPRLRDAVPQWLRDRADRIGATS